MRGAISPLPHPAMLPATASHPPLPFAQGRAPSAARPASPGEGKVHEADDGEAEQSDGVRPVEEVDGDVLHLLLVDHPEMHLVVHIIFAQGPAPHAGRHGPPPRPAAAAAAPARGGWEPGGDEPQRESGWTPGPGLARSKGKEQREGQAREGGVAAPPTQPLAGGAARRAPAGVGGRASLGTRSGFRFQVEESGGRRRAGEGKLWPLAGSVPRTPPALPPRSLADGLAHSGLSPRGLGS